MTSLSSPQTVSVQQQQQQPKEQIQFFLSNDFYKSLIYFQLKPNDDTQSLKVDEQKIKEHFKSNEVIQNVIQSIYVLHENTSILIVAKDSSNDVDLDKLEALIKTQAKLDNLHLERKDLPCSFEKASPLLLTTEINDSQLELISKDKYEAIKTIEAKTGLKLKKIKKSIYFSGLLFQFNILNEILAKNAKKQ